MFLSPNQHWSRSIVRWPHAASLSRGDKRRSLQKSQQHIFCVSEESCVVAPKRSWWHLRWNCSYMLQSQQKHTAILFCIRHDWLLQKCSWLTALSVFFLRLSSAMFFYVCLMLQNWNLRGNYSTPLGIVFKLRLNFLTDFQQHCFDGAAVNIKYSQTAICEGVNTSPWARLGTWTTQMHLHSFFHLDEEIRIIYVAFASDDQKCTVHSTLHRHFVFCSSAVCECVVWPWKWDTDIDPPPGWYWPISS